MRTEHHRFRLGEIECVALCDGRMDYDLESMVANAEPVKPNETLVFRI